MTMEIDAFYRGAKVRPLDPCEACAEKNAEIARLRRTLEKQRGALNQASFCLRELLPDDYDAKFTVGIINSALALVPNARNQRRA